MILTKLKKAGLISPPKFLIDNVCYLTQMGSNAYGVSSQNSDLDIYGYCIPHKSDVFPHLKGEIQGFGRQIQKFEQWQEHHVRSPDTVTEYDFSVYNIVKYFQLCMENNPNMIDSLFTPRRCVLYSNQVGEYVRDNRRMFLHKGAWHKFKGYAYAQMTRIRSRTNAENEKRAADIQKFGYDLKFAYHVVRLLNEVEQIMVEADLDLERNREQLKSIRRGEWKLEEIEKYFQDKEAALERVYSESKLQHAPDEEAIKQILLNALEMHYGSLDKCIEVGVDVAKVLNEIEAIVNRYRKSI